MPFINYVSGEDSYYSVSLQLTMICTPVSSAALTTIFASYELSSESSPEPLNFMTINPTTGVITTASTSVSSGDYSYKVKVTGKAANGYPVS
jgi:hypothetical protein